MRLNGRPKNKGYHDQIDTVPGGLEKKVPLESPFFFSEEKKKRKKCLQLLRTIYNMDVTLHLFTSGELVHKDIMSYLMQARNYTSKL
jgi:hypothetical protein